MRERTRGFFPGGGVTCEFVFENEDDVLLSSLIGGFTQFVVDRSSVGNLIFQPPEIKDADAIGVKGLGQFEGAIQQFVLLLESVIGIEGVPLFRDLGERCARPIHFEDRTRNVGHAHLGLFQQVSCLGDLFRV